MYEITPEVLEKARKADTKEELLKLAKENGIDMNSEDAEAIFCKFHQSEGKMPEEELDSVAGGSDGLGGCNDAVCNVDFMQGETLCCSPFQFSLPKGCDANCGTVTYH
ncbi:MAG: hypothetical protein NC313_17080 [Butyrivibrio sp.]|nr:hypothetical protein [Butyrivibrio sp.]